MAGWSISKRINVLAGALIAAIVVVALLGVAAVLRLTTIADEARRAAEQALLVTDIQEDMAEARLAGLRYRDTPVDAVADEVASNLAEIAALAPELDAAFGAEDPLLPRIRELTADISDYGAGFARTVTAQAAYEAAVLAQRDREAGLRALLNALQSDTWTDGDARAMFRVAAAQQSAFDGLLAFKRFLIARSAEDLGQATTHLDEARATLDGVRGILINAGRASDVDAALASLEAYRQSVVAASAADAARQAERDAADALGPRTQDALDLLIGSLVERQRALAERAEATGRWTLLALALASAFAAAAASILAIAIARTLRRDVSQSVAEMTAIAGGDLDAEISRAEFDHEFGQMGRALTVFRDTARNSRRLAAEQAEAERQRQRAEAERARTEAETERAKQSEIARERRATIAELKESIGGVVEQAAAGDFSGRITARFGEEQLDELAADINQLVENVEAGLNDLAAVLSGVADGDLTRRMQGEYHGVFAALQSDVNGTIGTLSGIVADIVAQCDRVIERSSEMSGQSLELARRAEQQAASLEETSAAMEEIAASARTASDSAASSSGIADAATARVDEAGRVVASAVGAMGDIRAASTRIGEIVSVIDAIAFQTNLLALNASVEAARAGSAGKGFAVVATEVRALAQRSSAASQDIKALIDESAAQVTRGVDLVENTGATLGEIVEAVRSMAASMRELVTTGREQATGVQEVTMAISQLDSITQKNAALSEQSRGTAGALMEGAEAMRRTISALRIEGSGAPRARPDRPRAGLAA